MIIALLLGVLLLSATVTRFGVAASLQSMGKAIVVAILYGVLLSKVIKAVFKH